MSFHYTALLYCAEVKKKLLFVSLSILNHIFMQSLLHLCCLCYENTFNSFLLSSLELICSSIYLLIKSPTHFSPRGIYSSHPVSLGEHVLPTDSTQTSYLKKIKIKKSYFFLNTSLTLVGRSSQTTQQERCVV